MNMTWDDKMAVLGKFSQGIRVGMVDGELRLVDQKAEKATLPVMVWNDKGLDLGVDGTNGEMGAHILWELNFTGNNYRGIRLWRQAMDPKSARRRLSWRWRLPVSFHFLLWLDAGLYCFTEEISA